MCPIEHELESDDRTCEAGDRRTATPADGVPGVIARDRDAALGFESANRSTVSIEHFDAKRSNGIGVDEQVRAAKTDRPRDDSRLMAQHRPRRTGRPGVR